VTGAAGITPLPLQPAEGMLHKGGCLLPLWPRAGSTRCIGRIEQLNESGSQLLRSPPLGLTLQSMPVTVADAKPPVQLPRGLLTPRRPVTRAGGFVGVAGGGHWTDVSAPRHPDAMQQRPRSPRTPIRWLHQLAGLMAQVSRAERLTAGDESLQARRLRQRMALAQRLLDPLPKPLQPRGWREQSLWTALRWGGAGLLLALWLHR